MMRVCKRVSDGLIIESQSGDGGLDVLVRNAIAGGYSANEVEALEMSDADYVAAMEAQRPPVRRLIPKSIIIARLTDAQLEAALAILTARQKERWRAPDKPAVYFDDPETLAILSAVGADPAVVMASE